MHQKEKEKKKTPIFYFWHKITLFFFKNVNEVTKLWMTYLSRKHWIPDCTLLELDSSKKQKQINHHKNKHRAIRLAYPCLPCTFPDAILGRIFVEIIMSFGREWKQLPGQSHCWSVPERGRSLADSQLLHGHFTPKDLVQSHSPAWQQACRSTKWRFGAHRVFQVLVGVSALFLESHFKDDNALKTGVSCYTVGGNAKQCSHNGK